MIQALIASVVSSFLGLIGGFVLLSGHASVLRWSRYFVSFAAGTLLGAAFFDLLSEAVHEFPDSVTFTFGWVMAGFLLYFVIERLLLWHHHSHNEELHGNNSVLAPLAIVGDAIHNLIDGLVIGAAFIIDPAIGVTTAVAVLAHELPQEIGDFSILIHSGMRRGRIAWWNIVGAFVSPIGTLLAFAANSFIDGIMLPLLGLSAGMFIYIGAADLIPEIHREKKLASMFSQLLLLVLGVLTILGFHHLFPGG